MSYQPIPNPMPVTDNAGSLTVDGSVAVSNLPASQAVTGPLTDTQLRASAVPVSGSFFQATQPVSLAATVPVSGPLTDSQLRASAVPVSIAATLSTNATLQALAAATSTAHAVVSLGNSQGKVVVGKPGSLASSAVTANQTITGASGTVTTGKTFYVQALQVQARLTTFAATATLFGTASFRIATVALLTVELAGPGIDDNSGWIVFDEPIPIAAATAYDWVCTPAAVTAMTWKANIVGYEK